MYGHTLVVALLGAVGPIVFFFLCVGLSLMFYFYCLLDLDSVRVS